MSFHPPVRLLMGPGPSNVSDAVLRATSLPTIGHLDPEFLVLMDAIKDKLRSAIRSNNAMTFPLSAPASAAMEMGFINLLEPGDEVVICINGVFGKRMQEIAGRCGADVHCLEFPWGDAVDPNRLKDFLKNRPRAKVVAFVHGETSTGVLSDAEALCSVVWEHGAMVLVDAVTSFAGVPLLCDDWGIDFLYTGTQKCLSCPPGLAPISLSERAVELIHARSKKVQSWFLDLSLMNQYWSSEGKRSYHHTAPINALYGLNAALDELLAEGLEQSWERHAGHHKLLAEGLSKLGLDFHVAESKQRLPQLNAVKIPRGVDDAQVRRDLLEKHGIEIGVGLGPLSGKIWRIGLMGNTSCLENINRLMAALRDVLP